MRTTRMMALGIFGVVGLAACGSSSRSGSGSSYGGSPSSSTKPAGATAKVSVLLSTGSSAHLVGPNQHALYLFEKDQGTTTACTGGCAAAWPPLVIAGKPVAGPGVHAGELGTANGIKPGQVTYHGHLLYFFGGDQAPGDTNGRSVPSWYLVDVNGQAIGG